MSASRVPPRPSRRPVLPPPVLARTSSTFVLSRKSSQRTAISLEAPWAVDAIPAPRAVQWGKCSARYRPVTRRAPVERLVERVDEGVGVDEGLGRRVTLTPGSEDVLLLHLRERLVGVLRT